MVLRCAFFHLSRVAEDGNYYRPQRHQDADALYAFKSRGFAGEIGLVIADTPLAPALYTWAAGWKPASFLIQIKAPRSAPTYAVISWEHNVSSSDTHDKVFVSQT